MILCRPLEDLKASSCLSSPHLHHLSLLWNPPQKKSHRVKAKPPYRRLSSVACYFRLPGFPGTTLTTTTTKTTPMTIATEPATAAAAAFGLWSSCCSLPGSCCCYYYCYCYCYCFCCCHSHFYFFCIEVKQTASSTNFML